MKINLFISHVLIGLGILALQGCPEPDKKPAKVSYAYEDLSTSEPKAVLPTGSSSIQNLQLTSVGGMTYDQTKKGWDLKNTGKNKVVFQVNLNQPTNLQIAIQANFEDPVQVSSNGFYAEVNGRERLQFSTFESYDYETNLMALQIPESYTQSEDNIIKIYEVYDQQSAVHIRKVLFLPQKITSSDGVLTTTLYTQFGETDLVKGTVAGAIWTRAYGLSETMEMIPGPTLYYNPGDLLEVNIKNQLNPATSQALQDYQKIMEDTLNPDEVLAGDAVRGEINIPHNLNNTNLHVHGLHVDPSKDDVTIVIVPEGESNKGYDAPHSNHPVRKIKDLNQYSVADQSVKKGDWLYQYRIPEFHLPGTHWFHPHKHGSTSAQVENGLAGTMVIMENKTNAIVPYPGEANSVDNGKKTQNDYKLDHWRGKHDRVLTIQEITNYGLQFGKGNAQGKVADPKNGKQIDLTVNGEDSLVISMRPGQLERWRLVNAGTNHRAFSHVWLGKIVGADSSYQVGKNKNGKPIYAPKVQSADMYMVATDGISHAKKTKVTASKPALLAPGNRTDFLVSLEQGDYILFKNYAPPYGLVLLDSLGNTIYKSNDETTRFNPARLALLGYDDAYLFKPTGTTPDNYMGFQHLWNESEVPTKKSVVPILKVKPTATTDGDFLEMDFKVSAEFGSGTGFTPVNNNDGVISDGELMWINVKGTPVSGNESPYMPNNDYLSRISPAAPDQGLKPPAYVAPINNNDILQSRPVIFDISGTAVKVINNNNPENAITVNQFTLNGREFFLNDPIGNTHANEDHIQKGYKSPVDDEYAKDRRNITQKLEYVNAVPIQWNTNRVDDHWYYVNPGYYQDIMLEEDKKTYEFDGKGKPSWYAVSGIPNKDDKPQMAVVNPKNRKAEVNKGNIPGLPIATTAEEWILINNSDVGHPFHIHINPFFIVEVGQLGYENYKIESKGDTIADWFMRAKTAEGGDWPQRDKKPALGAKESAIPGTIYKGEIDVDGIVGNWWDTIVVPAHGYVKVRYWMNVPEQSNNEDINRITVTDDVNRTGIWVYHCHILRHEDRGMMMPVITRPGVEK
ncbi:MAG: multicopper oxidase domain-containing protein [Cytophagales bacterium]|nr:multicopper oxidase domain-containing protein [Cytophagales bacterium]